MRLLSVTTATALAATLAAGTPVQAADNEPPAPDRLATVLGDGADPSALEPLDAAEKDGGEPSARQEAPQTLAAEETGSWTGGCVQPAAVPLVDRVAVLWPAPADPAAVTAVEVLRQDPSTSALSLAATLGPTVRQWTDRTDHGGTNYAVRFRLAAGGTTPTTGCTSAGWQADHELAFTTWDGGDGSSDSLHQGALGSGGRSAALQGSGAVVDVSYSPDGTLLAYSAPAEDGSLDLFLRLSNGTGSPARLTRTLGVDEWEPSWSPDSRRILVSRADATDVHLATLDLSTRAMARVAGSTWAAGGDWLPDGSAVVAADLASETAGLVRIAYPGGARSSLAGTEGGFSPRLSPDGARIAFVRQVYLPDEQLDDQLLLVPAGGGAVTTVATSVTDNITSPVWMPDGRLWWLQHGDVGGAQTRSSTAAGGDVRDEQQSVLNGTPGWSFDVRSDFSPATSNFVRDPGWSDVLARDSAGTLFAYQRAYGDPWARPAWHPRTTVGAGWNVMTSVSAGGDLTGDQQADLLARDRDGRLWVYASNGRLTAPSSWRPRRLVGTGWNVMTAIVGAGDKTGDGRADVLARDLEGRLWLYPGNGLGGVSARRQVGAGWNVMTSIIAMADVTYDGLGDVVARDRDGRLWLYQSAPGGGFGARRQLGSGWNVMTAIVGSDSPTSGQPAILARDTSGRLWQYPFSATSWLGSQGLSFREQVGSGWNVFTAITG